MEGYAPFFAYLAQEGYGVNVNLREGSTHVQKEAAAFLSHSLEYARRITDLPLLVRMDAGNDALEKLNVCLSEEVDFIIKRNLRRESPEEWLKIARKDGMCYEEREGKRVYLGSMEWTDKKLERPIRVVYQVIERTVEADGQSDCLPASLPRTIWFCVQASLLIICWGQLDKFPSKNRTLRFGRQSPWFRTFQRIYGMLSG